MLTVRFVYADVGLFIVVFVADKVVVSVAVVAIVVVVQLFEKLQQLQ